MQIKSNLYSDKPKLGDSILKGATIGAGIGAFTGMVVGYMEADKKVNSLPIESVTVTFKEPLYETKEIGKIPEDKYVKDWPGWNGWKDIYDIPTKPVYEKVPLKDENGNVIYKEHQQTFQGHGKPVVQYDPRGGAVFEPIFNGYDYEVFEDTKTNCYTNGEEEVCQKYVVGYWIKFYPDIDYKVIDTYGKPVVKFQTGVSYGGHMILGRLSRGSCRWNHWRCRWYYRS